MDQRIITANSLQLHVSMQQNLPQNTLHLNEIEIENESIFQPNIKIKPNICTVTLFSRQ